MTELPPWIERVVLVSWQRWAIILVALGAAAGSSTITAIAAGTQTAIVFVVIVALAVAAVIRPDSHAAAAVMAVVVWQWLAAVDDSMTPWAPALALTLLLFHTAVALMAVTPSSANVDRTVLWRWFRRCCWVILATCAIAALVALMNQRNAAGSVSLTVVGLVTLTVLLLVARSAGTAHRDDRAG